MYYKELSRNNNNTANNNDTNDKVLSSPREILFESLDVRQYCLFICVCVLLVAQSCQVLRIFSSH